MAVTIVGTLEQIFTSGGETVSEAVHVEFASPTEAPLDLATSLVFPDRTPPVDVRVPLEAHLEDDHGFTSVTRVPVSRDGAMAEWTAVRDSITRAIVLWEIVPLVQEGIDWGQVSAGDTGGADGWRKIEIGEGAEASGEDTIAIGVGADAAGRYSNAIGRNASAAGSSSNAIGHNAVGSTLSSAIGVNAVAAGGISNAIGHNARAAGNGSNAIGLDAVASDSGNALGNQASAAGTASNAIGQDASAAGNASNAIGQDAVAAGRESNAIGRNASAAGNASNAIGHDAVAAGSSSNAIGRNASAAGNASNAIGVNASAAGSSSNAIGHNAGVPASSHRSSAIGTDAAIPEYRLDTTVIAAKSLQVKPHILAGTLASEHVLYDTSGAAHTIGVSPDGLTYDGDPVGGISSVEWDDIDGKPTEFPPSPHDHDWDDIDGKPTEFPPSPHDHDSRYYTQAEVDALLALKETHSFSSNQNPGGESLAGVGTYDTAKVIKTGTLQSLIPAITTGLWDVNVEASALVYRSVATGGVWLYLGNGSTAITQALGRLSPQTHAYTLNLYGAQDQALLTSLSPTSTLDLRYTGFSTAGTTYVVNHGWKITARRVG